MSNMLIWTAIQNVEIWLLRTISSSFNLRKMWSFGWKKLSKFNSYPQQYLTCSTQTEQMCLPILPSPMRIIHSVKHHQTNRFRFADTLLTFLKKVVPEAKTSICSSMEETIILYCRKFLRFVTIFIIL